MRYEGLATVVVVLLAGCTDSGEPASSPVLEDAGASGETEADGLNLSANGTLPLPNSVLYGGGCDMDAALFFVPSAAGEMPSGFTTSNPQQVVFSVMSCGNSTWQGVELGPVLTALQFLIVTPPAELADDANITLYFLGRMASPDARVGGAFANWSVGDVGGASVTIVETPAARSAHIEGTVGGTSWEGPLTTAAGTGPASQIFRGAPEAPATYRFFSVQDGAVGGWVDIFFDQPTQWWGASAMSITGGTGSMGYPDLAGLAISRHDMPTISMRYTVLEGPPF